MELGRTLPQEKKRMRTGTVAYLLHDCAGTLDELPLGEAISGAELQSSSFLDQVDASVAQLLNPGLYLVANLEAQQVIAVLACSCLLI